jgi:hypothetical protein
MSTSTGWNQFVVGKNRQERASDTSGSERLSPFTLYRVPDEWLLWALKALVVSIIISTAEHGGQYDHW